MNKAVKNICWPQFWYRCVDATLALRDGKRKAANVVVPFTSITAEQRIIVE